MALGACRLALLRLVFYLDKRQLAPCTEFPASWVSDLTYILNLTIFEIARSRDRLRVVRALGHRDAFCSF